VKGGQGRSIEIGGGDFDVKSGKPVLGASCPKSFPRHASLCSPYDAAFLTSRREAYPVSFSSP
jgi:hypothetical protein